MKNIFVPVFILLSFALKAQYYYNDILYAQQLGNEMKSFNANKVKSVSASGYTPQGSAAIDFAEVKTILDKGKTLKISETDNQNHTETFYMFDDAGKLLRIADTSLVVQNVTVYQYDNSGKIIAIQNSVADSAHDFNQTEKHEWLYDAAGKPAKMLRTINNSDSLQIVFTKDENGNIADETSYRNGKEFEKIYYYYDSLNRMTDIVRYNKKYNKLLPDEMFDYDESNHVIQMVTTTSKLSLGYLIWRYIYNDKGLKTKEALFNKEKELTGKIEYTYTFEK